MKKKHLGRRRKVATLDRRLRNVGAIWALRILVHTDVIRRLYRGRDLRGGADDILAGLDLEEVQEDAPDREELGRLLARRLEKLESRGVSLDAEVAANIADLGDVLGLDSVERDILTFCALLERLEWLAEVADLLGDTLSRRDVSAVLAVVLDHPTEEIQDALSWNGTLHQSGLLDWKSSCRNRMSDLLMPLEGFSDMILGQPDGAGELLARYFQRAAASELSLDDFEHMGAWLGIIRGYLSATADRTRTGVNLLFYGPPGTGKTECARVLATALDVPLYEVAYERDGEPIESEARFAAYKLTQRALTRAPGCLVVFDEVEDVFPETSGFGLFMAPKARACGKAWVNRTLEENPVPAIWIANEVQHLDPAYLRRFDLVVPFKSPPPEMRKRLMSAELPAELVGDGFADRVAANDDVTAADISRMGKVMDALSAGESQETEDRALQVLNASLDVRGHKRIKRPKRAPELAFRMDWLNADTDIEMLAESARRATAIGMGARVLLHGPPGTGKSAFARHLATHLGLPVVERKASEIFTPWLGESEKNIARAFDEAREREAMLIIDEVDSFMQDRRGASQRWETAITNELLTQLEQFDGALAMTTNLLETLDQASLRRFDWRVEMKELKLDQIASVLEELASVVGLSDLAEVASAEARRLHSLTLGDVAVALRQLALLESPDAEAIFSSLERQIEDRRTQAGRPIGFLQS